MIGYGDTNIGKKRKNNEDSYFINNNKISNFSNLYIIADGMGGHKAGEVASSKSVEIFLEFIKTREIKENNKLNFMIEGINYTNYKIFKASKENYNYEGMGTTFTICTIENNKIYICHIGDSRLYIINKDCMNLITTDHSYINEMIKAGKLTKEEAKNHPKKNILTKVLGTNKYINPDKYEIDLKKDDKILMCTDGLTNIVNKNEIKNIVMEDIPTNKKIENLINKANENGGIDNITVIVIEKRCQLL